MHIIQYSLLAKTLARALDDVILERRKRESNPTIYRAFEDLYYAIKKYEQTPSKALDDVKTHRFED